MFQVKYTPHFLAKMEDLMAETDYILRYEKGNFKSGFCILKDTKVAVVNKYYPLEGKINSLLEIIKTIPVESTRLSEKSRKLYADITNQNPTLF